MLVIFCPKIFDRAENRIRRRLPQTAQGCRLYGLTQFDQPFDITCLALTLGDPFKDIQHSASAQAAGHTFTAGFILDKIHEKTGHIDHASVFIHADQTARSHDRAQFYQGLVVDWRVEVGPGQTATRWSASLGGLEFFAIGMPPPMSKRISPSVMPIGTSTMPVF